MSAKAYFLKKLTRARVLKGGFVIGSTGVGAVSGVLGAEPGFRYEGLKEGAISGAVASGAVLMAPQAAKTLAIGAKQRMKNTQVGRAARKVNVVFRRIRGRIVAMRVNKNG